MRVFEGVASVDESVRGSVLTVGNFDGVHLGHQRILRTARAQANVSGVGVIAMTFEPHPLELLTPDNAPARLTCWEEKVYQLERAGADAVVKLKTDWPLLSLAADDFVQEILVKRIGPSCIVEGPNFGFGRGRKGNVQTLQALADDFTVRIAEPYRLHLEGAAELTVVSSTVVRECLQRGRVAAAAACLGRPYTLVGRVVRGAGAGRHLGYPTINLDVGDQLVPAEGVYAGTADLSGKHETAAISIGHRPTLGGTTLVVEAFLLDASDDFYGRSVRLNLVEHVRGQVKFDTREALTAQISRDVETVRRIIANLDRN